MELFLIPKFLGALFPTLLASFHFFRVLLTIHLFHIFIGIQRRTNRFPRFLQLFLQRFFCLHSPLAVYKRKIIIPYLNNMRKVFWTGSWQSHNIIIHVFSCCKSFDQSCRVLVPEPQPEWSEEQKGDSLDRQINSSFLSVRLIMKDRTICSLLFIFQHE